MKKIWSIVSLLGMLNIPHVTAAQFVWVESKQLCKNINTLLEIKEKILLIT
jgi:hypothetical protein